MAKFQLQENETLIGSGLMAFRRGRITGTIYVTNQRLCFQRWIFPYTDMDLMLSEVAGYRVTRFLFITFVSIYDRSQKRYIFSGFPAKKLQGWLEQAGVKKLAQ